MKLPAHMRIPASYWRGREGRLYRLGELIAQTGYSLQDAKKPYDLVFPITRLTDLTIKARDMQWEWVAEKIGLDKRDMGRWPHV